jgi:DNA-binding FadR family transcriptional regulator
MRRGTSEDVVERLATEIQDGTLAPGQRIPSERHLAAQLGVSRPMLREALRRLGERGLLEVRAGRGSFVSGTAARAPLRPLDSHYRRRGTTARQLSEARLMLECETASLAAERATPEQVTEIARVLEALEASAAPLDAVRNDLAFHLAVAHAAQNPVIESMLESIAGLTAELMVRSVGDPAVAARSAPYHRLAYEAIARRDPPGAREAMRTHLSVASETFGEDYDQTLDSMATRALRMLGAGEELDEFLGEILQDRPVD